MKVVRTKSAITYSLNDGMRLRICKEDKHHQPMFLIDKDGDRMAVTMYQLLTAVSAAYNNAKENAK